MHHKQQSELLVHISPPPLSPVKNPRPAYHQRPQQTTVQVLNTARRVTVKDVFPCDCVHEIHDAP